MKNSVNSADDIGARIMSRIDDLAALSESSDGLTRRSFTPEHRQANDLVAIWMREAGMQVREDAIGNVIGRYEGEREGLPAVMIGSHLDTVVMAGKYDGMLGVLTGIACVEALNKSGARLPFAVEVIGFVDEEGVRFQSTYLGSRAVTGRLDKSWLALEDKDGISLAAALEDFGLDPSLTGKAARPEDELVAYLEVHIEQGPVLESKELPVGVVTAIAGATRALVSVEGVAGHAGTVPMRLRRDALAAAAECITAIETICIDAQSIVGTIGEISIAPGASNVIPGLAKFTIDLRAATDSERCEAFRKIEAKLSQIADLRELKITTAMNDESSSTPCDDRLKEIISRAIGDAGFQAVEMPSGAGHDAAAMSDLTPTGMIFVRCEGGFSHSPLENIMAGDAAIAAEVMGRVLEYLAERP